MRLHRAENELSAFLCKLQWQIYGACDRYANSSKAHIKTMMGWDREEGKTLPSVPHVECFSKAHHAMHFIDRDNSEK